VAITRKWLVKGALIALLCSMAVAQETARSGSMPLQAIIQSMQKGTSRHSPESRLSGNWVTTLKPAIFLRSCRYATAQYYQMMHRNADTTPIRPLIFDSAILS
jgi:hypothetical protein